MSPVKSPSLSLALRMQRHPSVLMRPHAPIHSGTRWWTFRSEPLLCEWVEMKKSKLQRELEERKAQQEGRPVEPLRVLLYIHGGAHHFSSLDTHRCESSPGKVSFRCAYF